MAPQYTKRPKSMEHIDQWK